MKMKKLGVWDICAIIAILALLVLCWYVFKAGVWCGEAHKTFAVREAFKAGMNSKINFTLSDGSSVPDDERDACLKSFAESLKSGKGYCGQYAPLRKGTHGKTFFVCVHNLNLRQKVGDFARHSLHFENLSDLRIFLAVYMNHMDLWPSRAIDFDPDPAGEYFYDESYVETADWRSDQFWL